VPPKPRAKTAAEMMRKLKLQAAAGNSGQEDERAEAAGAAIPTPVRATSSTRAEQREAVCAAQAKGVNSGGDDEQAEPAGGGERRACQGNDLHARQAV
jgi:hypothetical protein